MPLTLNVGLSKKIGQPRYGSLGASCHVTVELEHSLLASDPEKFQGTVRQAYVACAQAVNDELARHQTSDADAGNQQSESNQEDTTSSNGHRHGNGAGSHQASQKQLDYAGQLAGQIRGLGVRKLEALAERMFAKPLADLTSQEASRLIDALKAMKEGQIDFETALEETAA